MIDARRMVSLFVAMAIFVPMARSAPHTPKPGDPERKAICDAMRAFVVRSQSRPLPKPIVFKIEFLRADGAYACFEGIPVFSDGSEAVPNYLPDIVFTTILRREAGGWKVICDLSRTDVPSESEMAGIRKSVPAEVPGAILPEFWRGKLRR
ncbi:MAG: hypothetical protein WCS65_14825 [Verrucomicrobiae bacterium]